MKKNNRKDIGDTTSFTIPERFIHIDTNEVMPVSAKMIQFINEHITKRNLVHAIMTSIYNQNHGSAQSTEDMERIETKVDLILEKINEGKVAFQETNKGLHEGPTNEDLNSIIEGFEA